MGEAEVGDAHSFFRLGRSMLVVGSGPNLSPLLRRVVLVVQLMRLNKPRRDPLYVRTIQRLCGVSACLVPAMQNLESEGGLAALAVQRAALRHLGRARRCKVASVE